VIALVEGVVLEVEPEEGGAVDYRERRRAAPADPEGPASSPGAGGGDRDS